MEWPSYCMGQRCGESQLQTYTNWKLFTGNAQERYRESFLAKPSFKWGYGQADQFLPLLVKIRIERWRWIWHVMSRDGNTISRTALTWASEGKRRQGRSQATWRWSAKRERVKVDGMAVIGGSNGICERLGWVESISEWPYLSCRARYGTSWKHILSTFLPLVKCHWVGK